MKSYDVGIIGAGPAGMMAAITAARAGKRVILIEKNDSVGRKLLATGNGRCNLTNRNISLDRYHGADSLFIETVLDRFDPAETIKFFESMGVLVKEEDNGRIFPRSNQASTIVETLNQVLSENKVVVKAGSPVKAIEKENRFTIRTEDGDIIVADKLILTTGGKAAFQFGSSGDGIFWAEKFGHNIEAIYASLVPVETQETWTGDIQGVKIEARVRSFVDGKMIRESCGDCLFTHFGLSGPAIMAQSGQIASICGDSEVKIHLDLLPEMSDKELDEKLEEIFRNNGRRDIKNAIIGILPAKLAITILENSGINLRKNAAELSKKERLAIVQGIKDMVLSVKKVRPLKEAQVSRGGVDTLEIDPKTLESKLVRGLYFAGEIMDVDGDSGGFNLQWAWSSGFVAGQLGEIH